MTQAHEERVLQGLETRVAEALLVLQSIHRKIVAEIQLLPLDL